MKTRYVLFGLMLSLCATGVAREIWWLPSSDPLAERTSVDGSFFANGERLREIRPDLADDPSGGDTTLERTIVREVVLSRAARRQLERTRGLEGYVSRTTAYSTPDGLLPVPEPSSAFLLWVGLATFALRRPSAR